MQFSLCLHRNTFHTAFTINRALSLSLHLHTTHDWIQLTAILWLFWGNVGNYWQRGRKLGWGNVEKYLTKNWRELLLHLHKKETKCNHLCFVDQTIPQHFASVVVFVDNNTCSWQTIITKQQFLSDKGRYGHTSNVITRFDGRSASSLCFS